MRYQQILVTLLSSSFAILASARAQSFPGTGRITLYNYEDCIELKNDVGTRIVLGHQVGGRVLIYSQNGKDALYLDPREAKWGTPEAPSNPVASAGRFDIGPEYLIPRRNALWTGAWKAEITGPRAARLTSVKDQATGVQLIRDFVLSEKTSQLSCTQIVRNVSKEPRRWCHWSRTFAVHGGIAIVPLTPETSKFPNDYIMMESRNLMNIAPEDPNIRRKGLFLEIKAPPEHPKLGMDSHAGWLAYQMPNDYLFVKHFAADPARVYNEVAGLTVSIWYPQLEKTPACELEPIGPSESLQPGEFAEFTEHWQLLQNPFPRDGEELDLEAIGKIVESNSPPPLIKTTK